MDAEWKIAKITDTILGYEDHGFFTFTLMLDYGGGGQGVGMRAYGTSGKVEVEGSVMLQMHLQGVLAAAGVSTWEAMKGRTLMAYADYGKVYALKPLPTESGKEFWFDERDRPPTG